MSVVARCGRRPVRRRRRDRHVAAVDFVKADGEGGRPALRCRCVADRQLAVVVLDRAGGEELYPAVQQPRVNRREQP